MHRYLNQQKLDEICRHYEISGQFAHYLRTVLINYKLVLVCDDSSSMNQPTNYHEPRWAELCRFVTTVFSVTECIEQSPLDVYFLNRPSVLSVQQLQQITAAFEARPHGWTPIVPVLRHALAQPCDESYRGRIIVLCTDGEPTNEKNHADTAQLRRLLMEGRRATDFVTVLACTDDDDAIGYLNRWDVEIPRLDVVDDYTNERKEVQRAQGRQFAFTFGDYVVKILLGAVVPALDKLDEVQYGDVDCRGCVVS